MGVQEISKVDTTCQKFNQWGGEDEKLVFPFGRFRVGSPSSKLKFDEDWDQFCQARVEVDDSWAERSTFMPAELSYRALIKQIDRYRMPRRIGSRFANLVESWMRELLEPYCAGYRVLTEEEALNGLSDEFGVLEPMNLATSPGFGFSNLGTSKKLLFERHQAFCDTIRRWDMQQLKAGNIPLWCFKGSEKDERRDWERVVDFKTRLFMAESWVVALNGRQLIGDFIRRFMKAGTVLSFFSAVGMEIYGGKWDEFVRYMTANLMVQTLFSYDMPKWDKEYPHEWHWADAQILADFCGDSFWRDIIIRHCARVAYGPCVLAITGALFITGKNNPSGDINTIIRNTMGIERCVIEAWLRSDGGSTLPNSDPAYGVNRMHRWLRNKTIGDDLLLTHSVGSPCSHEKIVEAFSDLGWIPEREGTGCLDDSRFAGRGSILAKLGGFEIFLPVIQRERILAVNEYRKGRPDPVKRLARAYAAAELAFPLLFDSEDSIFGRLYYYYMELKLEALRSNVPDLVAAAQGLPNAERMWVNYTGRPCPDRELSQLVFQQLARAARRERTTMDLGFCS